MRRIMYLVVLGSILAASLSAAYGEKLTTDPNAPGARSAPIEETPKTDARLAQKVSYEAKRTSVKEICAALTDLTGVKFNAGVNEKDWQVRDRKMNIFVKDANLADLMNSIARVMKFKWQISDKDNSPVYRLYMDRKTLLDAESQRLREEEKQAQRLAKKREKFLNDFGKLDNLSEQDLEKMKDENPFMYIAATSGLATGFGQFFKEVPVATEALASGRELSLNGADMSMQAQQGLVEFLIGYLRMTAPPSNKVESLANYISSNEGQISVKLEPSADSGIILGNISVKFGEKKTSFPFFDFESNFAKLMGKILIRCQEENRPVRELQKEIEIEIEKNIEKDIRETIISEMKSADLGEPAPEHPDDPALQEKVEITGNNLEEMEAALAKASNLSVVSDSFGKTDGFRNPFKPGEITLQEALDTISSTYRYNWYKRAGVIELRDKLWFKKRTEQIPDAWLEYWRSKLEKTGTLDIEDMAQIAALTYAQFEINVLSDTELMRSKIEWPIIKNRDLLRLYNVLEENQRKTIFSESGLNLRTLNTDQWKQCGNLINQQNPLLLKREKSALTLRGTRTQQSKIYTYTFTFSTSGDTRPVSLSFQTPQYKEPEKPKTEPTPVK